MCLCSGSSRLILEDLCCLCQCLQLLRACILSQSLPLQLHVNGPFLCRVPCKIQLHGPYRPRLRVEVSTSVRGPGYASRSASKSSSAGRGRSDEPTWNSSLQRACCSTDLALVVRAPADDVHGQVFRSIRHENRGRDLHHPWCALGLQRCCQP